MNRFRTEIIIDRPIMKIEYNDPIFMVGSCFAENIGERFIQGRFNCCINPHGILYNPASIGTSLIQIIKCQTIDDSQLIFQNGLWHSFDHHGDFSSVQRDEVVHAINKSLLKAHNHLKECKFLFLTFGTAWVFEHIQLKKIVSNCHKFPARAFHRYRLEVNEIVNRYKSLIIELRQFNPNLQIIFTVSPVRHIKDGAHGNQLSKATLLLAIDLLIEANKNIHYFPAYELVNDDLRDYRFYAEDMLHPNKQAVDYIWDKFCNSWLSQSALLFYKDSLTIDKACNHRPLFANSPEYEKFIRSTIKKIDQLTIQYPLANFNNDRELFTNRLEEQNFP